jgi:type IV pilus assembly protein PilO
MNILEELRALDPRDPGRWPLPVRIGSVAVAFLVLTVAGIYMLVWNEQRPELQRRQAEEQGLRAQFREKHAKAVNLELYKQQLKDIERSFGALLRQLPGRTEVPSLLVDISQTGLAAGLQEKLFQPQPEQKKDFYAELPIKIRLTGSYHQFGEFVSGIAALPRIVTLHDIDIKPDNKDAYDQLSLELTAKTYRYMDEGEIAAGEADKKKDVTHRPGPNPANRPTG